MSIVMLALGVLMTGAGAVMVGFGIPINEFSLGNTLIVAGTMAMVGGLIVISLAIVARHLVRLAALMHAQPMPRVRTPEGFEAAPPPLPPVGGPPRVPFPPKAHPEPHGREPSRDPRFAPVPETATDPIFERLRMNHPAAPGRNAAEPALVADEEAPLSPRVPPRIPFPPVPAGAAEPISEPRGFRPADLRPPKSVPDKGRNGAAPARPSEPNGAGFDQAWPAKSRPERVVEPFASEAALATAVNGEAHSSSRASDSTTILKSGVVDGMAYTLYADGSIEAELAHGVVRFGSIEELRNHLEKNG